MKFGRRAILFGVVLCAFSVSAAGATGGNALSQTYDGVTKPGTGTQVVHITGGDMAGTNGDIVYWKGQYVLFYRDDECWSGMTEDPHCQLGHDDLRWGIKRAVSTDGGKSFSSGKWILKPNLPPGFGCGGMAEPSAMIDHAGNIAIVYEAANRTNNMAGPLCEPNPQNSHQYVVIARSKDGGVSWSHFEKVLTGPAGYAGNYGTPEIQYVPGKSQIEISIHDYPGNNRPLTRRMFFWNTTDINNVHASNKSAPVEIKVLWPNGQPVTTQYGYLRFDGGIGKGDITHWAPPDKGAGDGYYYLAVEGNSGGADCQFMKYEAILLARSKSISGPYTVSPTAGVIAAHSPLRVCDYDMPNWWNKADGTIHLLYHHDVIPNLAQGLYDLPLTYKP